MAISNLIGPMEQVEIVGHPVTGLYILRLEETLRYLYVSFFLINLSFRLH